MNDEGIGRLAEDALATLRGLPDTQQTPAGVGWGQVMTFAGWSARRARFARQALGLRLAERGGSVVEDVRPGRY
jgi:hypothetical protein